MRGVRRFIRGLERRGASGWTPIAAAAWTGCLRFAGEDLLVYRPMGSAHIGPVHVGDFVAFYMAVILVVCGILKVLTPRNTGEILSIAAAGVIIGILPPLIDGPLYGPGNFSYAYRSAWPMGLEWLWIYDEPQGLPWGETITLWIGLIFVPFYVWIIGCGWRRVAAAFVAQYALLFTLSFVVPIMAFEYAEEGARYLWLPFVVCGMTALAFVGYGVLRPAIGKRVLGRLPHTLLMPNLVFVGAALTGNLSAETAVVAFTFLCLFTVLVVHNDYYDKREDEAAGRHNIVEEIDVVLVGSLVIGLLIVLMNTNSLTTLWAVVVLVVGYAYHADPFRLKCVFPLSYKSEGLWALLSLLAGATSSSAVAQPLTAGTFGMVVLVAAGFSVGAMFKDYKDVAGDKAGEVRTIYVVLGDRGWSDGAIQRLVLASLGLCLLVPPALLAAVGGLVMGALVLAVIGAGVVTVLALWSDRVRATRIALLGMNAYFVAAAVSLA